MFEKVRSAIDQLWPPPPTLTELNIPSQEGKVFMVTGGNSGIGFMLCTFLYSAGAKVYMASRSKERAEAAIKTIKKTNPNRPGQLIFLELDLNDLNSVKRAATLFAHQESRLDVLWNNATALAFALPPNARTEQNIESMMGVNCVAHLLLNLLLLPQLRASTSTARVIWTSSIGADDAPPNGIELEILDKGTTDRIRNYQASKAGNWILAREFARRCDSENILSVAVNPGNVKANSYTGAPWLMMLFMNRILQETRFGAYTQLWAGLSPDVKENGSYIIPWGRIRTDEQTVRKDIIKAMTPEEDGGLGYGKKFWDWCEEQWEPVVGKVAL